MTSVRTKTARHARRTKQQRRKERRQFPSSHLAGGSDGAATLTATPVAAPTRTASRPIVGEAQLPADGQPTHERSGLLGIIARHWAVLLVLSLFLVSAAIVPTMTQVPVGDDWVYAVSVETLVEEGRMEILDLSVTTLIFQVWWGALFWVLFGEGFGSLRLSSVVLFFLSGIAFYSLLRDLGVVRNRSAFGTAIYLFNPLSYVLAFTFMTDPQFVATMVISVALYAKGLRPDKPSRTALLLGSFFAGLAFLDRQQGALIPFGATAYLVATKRIWFNKASIPRFLEVVAIPATMTILYYLWLWLIHGVPEQQDKFVQQALDAGVGGTWKLLRQMTYIESAYVGLFVLPITLVALISLPQLLRARSGIGVAAFAGWIVIVVLGFVVFTDEGRKMPYISQYVGIHGLGPTDLQGGRPWLLDGSSMGTARNLVTWLCIGSALIFGLACCRKIGDIATPERATAGLIAMMGFWQVVGVMPPSFHFRNWIISVDRYLLPLLPFAVALMLWSLRDVRLFMPVGWLTIAIIGIYSVMGTRDHIVFQKATWDLARYANIEMGIPLTKLDGGASWDGYYLYEYSDTYGIPQQSVGGPWWTNLFATATDSTYVVSGSPNVPADYAQVTRIEYSSWLHPDPVYLYLLQRNVAQPTRPPLPPDLPPPPSFAPPLP